jgi:hypothetical protein
MGDFHEEEGIGGPRDGWIRVLDEELLRTQNETRARIPFES